MGSEAGLQSKILYISAKAQTKLTAMVLPPSPRASLLTRTTVTVTRCRCGTTQAQQSQDLGFFVQQQFPLLSLGTWWKEAQIASGDSAMLSVVWFMCIPWTALALVAGAEWNIRAWFPKKGPWGCSYLTPSFRDLQRTWSPWEKGTNLIAFCI